MIENSDVVIIINQEVKADTGEVYMTFKLLKRRYRSSETDEKLKRLDYFNHPYDPENGIRLIDDVNLPESLSLYSLATQFVALTDVKRGRRNAMERSSIDDEIDTKKNNEEDDGALEFDPFDANTHNQM